MTRNETIKTLKLAIHGTGNEYSMNELEEAINEALIFLEKENKQKCQFVLTYMACEGDINSCIGVYDDPDKCLGKILGMAIDESETCHGCEVFHVQFRHDDHNDDYYDIIVKFDDQNDEDIYRVFYLREDQS